MPNAIETFKKYVPLLDEVYKIGSLTSVLDGATQLMQETQTAGEFKIPVLDMDGLGDYSRTDGYTKGSVTLTFETKKANYDRGRKFGIDDADNKETVGLAFGKLGSEFIRTKAIPELDAFRFATYAKNAGTVKSGNLADGTAWLEALSEASTTMFDAEVTGAKILYITKAGMEAIAKLDTTKSKDTLANFDRIIPVPSNRFVSAIKMKTGKSGEEKGGYEKDSSGKNINFLVIDPNAVIQYPKNLLTKVFSPEENQESDQWLFFWHLYGIAEVYDNKKKGIYVHTATV